MRILVSGSSGLVGSALQDRLTQGAHEVVPLVRGTAQGAEIRWSPSEGTIESEKLDGIDAVVHLAGENIASGRWTDQKKERIRKSRVQGTQLLASAIADLERKPQVLVSASAIGYYGSRGAEMLDENSQPGGDFLAKTCIDWEAATQPAREAGIRVVNLRIGVILSRDGGALEKMLLPFKLGIGGRVGSGEQYWSWISLQDVTAAIEFAIESPFLAGPVNAVSPNPVTNREFTQTLGKALGRPTIFPMPAFAARIALGEMADALLLSSTRVYPRRLEDAGFSFEHPDLEGALRFHLQDSSRANSVVASKA